MKLKTEAELVVVGGVVLVIALWYAKNKAVAIGKEIAPYVDPTSSTNLAYTGVNSIGAWLSGQKNFDLGTATYDATHGGALDVTSSNNFVNQGMESAWRAITGDQNWTLGGKIYDWTH